MGAPARCFIGEKEGGGGGSGLGKAVGLGTTFEGGLGPVLYRLCGTDRLHGLPKLWERERCF